jgi:hypothetical protein
MLDMHYLNPRMGEVRRKRPLGTWVNHLKMCHMGDARCLATSYGSLATHSVEQGDVWNPAPLKRGTPPITSDRSQPGELHHIECRVDLEALAEDSPRGGLPSVYVRLSGYILLVVMAIVVCYSATL